MNDIPIPIEINFEIIKASHPHYGWKQCITDKKMLEYCESNKYDILQVWSYSLLSTKELRERLPNITWKQIVEISLMFHPIHESIGVWDPITLFYYSCKEQQDTPEIYLGSNVGVAFSTFNNKEFGYIVPWIIYKFHRLDVIERINSQLIAPSVSLLIIESLIDIKLGNPLKESPFLTPGNYGNIVYNTYNLCGTLLTYEEYLELIILMKKLRYNNILSLVLGHDNSQYLYYSDQIMGIYSLNIIGLDKANTLLEKYQMVGAFQLYLGDIDFNIKRYSRLVFIDEHLHPEFYEKCIATKYKGIHNLFRGNLIGYYSMLPLEINTDNVYDYVGINEFGGITRNNVIMNEYLSTLRRLYVSLYGESAHNALIQCR